MYWILRTRGCCVCLSSVHNQFIIKNFGFFIDEQIIEKISINSLHREVHKSDIFVWEYNVFFLFIEMRVLDESIKLYILHICNIYVDSKYRSRVNISHKRYQKLVLLWIEWKVNFALKNMIFKNHLMILKRFSCIRTSFWIKF